AGRGGDGRERGGARAARASGGTGRRGDRVRGRGSDGAPVSSAPRGYSPPLSPTGSASLVPSPPWHYVGDFLVIEYWADPAAVAAVLPPGLSPFADDPGRCAALFVDWQSCSDGGGELLDPARSQYKEFFIVVNATLGGEL